MEYWLSHKSGRVIEQVLCDDGEAPRWSDDSKRCTKVQVERHGDLLAETFDFETLTWSPSIDYAIHCLKQERNSRLVACDFPPLVERPEEQQPAWREYRQALRDLPSTTADPFNPEWPTPPTFGT